MGILFRFQGSSEYGFSGWSSLVGAALYVSGFQEPVDLDQPSMRGRVHICPIFNLDSLGSTIRQAPEFPLNIALSDIDFAERPV